MASCGATTDRRPVRGVRRLGRPARPGPHIGLALLLIGAAGVPRAAGQGVIRDSIGATSSGRGGTNLAFSDNLNLILDNPAGLVNLSEDRRLDFGLDTLVTNLHYSDPLGHSRAETVPFPLPQFGYMQKSPDGRLAYAIGVFAPAGFGAHYRQRHLLYGKREYTSLGALIKVLPAVAYRVSDRLSVGGTLGLGFSHIDLEAPFALQRPPFSGIPMTLDLQARGFALNWSLGLQYDLTEQTRIGLVYQSESRFRLEGHARGDISGIGVPLLKADYDAEVDLVWPRSAGIGVQHRFDDRHRGALDLLWFDWSGAFDQLDMRLSDGSNPLFNAIMGSSKSDTIPLDWKDGLAVRLGYEFDFTERDTLRLGYVFHENPIPDATLMPLLIGTLEHAATVGYGRRWDNWQLNAAYQYSWGSTNRVGFSRIAGGDYDFSSSRAEAHWFMLSLSCSF